MAVVWCEDRVPYIQGFATTNFSREIIVHCINYKIKLLCDDIRLSNLWKKVVFVPCLMQRIYLYIHFNCNWSLVPSVYMRRSCLLLAIYRLSCERQIFNAAAERVSDFRGTQISIYYQRTSAMKDHLGELNLIHLFPTYLANGVFPFLPSSIELSLRTV